MPQSISDEFFNGIANAVDDIRQKVVEEPFFGRAVTETGPQQPRWPEARELAQEREREPDRDTREPDLDR
jgi:hypothetical protein